MTRMGGLLQRLPWIGTALVMAMLAGCGLPGFANFVGEFMVFFGTWKSGLGGAPQLVGLAAWGGLIIGAVYMLRAVRQILHGPIAESCESAADASPWRRLPFAVLLGALFLFGLFPALLTEKIKPSAALIVNMANGGSQSPPRKSPAGVMVLRMTKPPEVQSTEPGPGGGAR